MRLGQTDRVEAVLAGLDARERASAEMRTALACAAARPARPAGGDGRARARSSTVPSGRPSSHVVVALLLEATARDALGDPDAAGRALERALDLAEPDRVLIPFLVHPAPGLLQRHARHATAHAALIAEILSLLAGTSRPAAPPGGARSLREPLQPGETRVLRYLPTNLSTAEIARELYLSVNTVRRRTCATSTQARRAPPNEAVERARALGLLRTLHAGLRG